MIQVMKEATLLYQSFVNGILTTRGKCRTVLDGQFGWGGSLLKSNEGVSKVVADRMEIDL